MAKLKQIIGAFLTDISRARVISDTYSRELKASYKEDPFLKLLSVPRTDLKEVTIELKFSIKQLDIPENSAVEKDIEDIDVEVVTDELASLSEATLSSISIKLDLTSV
ncbi:MAG: hypothetical protein WBA89_18935 [Microcoleus sp.]|uniref:hypothetical protein n=1 Tax=Microcoleus sp. TaxID=44472 RepID=UPI003C772866